MSGIAGIFNRSLKKVELSEIIKIVYKLKIIGNDYQDYWVQDYVALGKATLQVNERNQDSTNVLSSENGKIYIVADCRIDNKQELIDLLQINLTNSSMNDTKLILKAYQKWGYDCVKYLIGDFAFIVWDCEKQQIFAARDPMGMRPLFYKTINGNFIFSSLIRSIEKTMEVSEWNTTYLADFLYRKGTCSEEETPYKSVKRLPKGSYMIVDPHDIKINKYWDLDVGKQIKYKNDSEYEEHFRDLFSKSVKGRIENVECTGVLLSGGLDSTSIYGSAKNSAYNKVFPISCVFDRYTDGDERYYIRYILDQYRERDHKCVVSDDLWILKGYPNFSIETDEPNRNQLSYAMLKPCYNIAMEQKAKVLLNGYAGDQVFGFNPYYIADFLKKFRILKFLQESSKLAKSYNYTLSGAIKEFGVNAIKGEHEQPTVLLPKVHGQCQERYQNENKIKNPGLRMQYRYIERSQGFHFAQFLSETNGLETRYPFLDVRLVEYLFSLPIEQKIDDAQTKVLLRRSLRGIVPDEILDRPTKSSTDMLIFQGLKNEWDKLYPALQKPLLAELGLIDGKVFLNQIDRYRHGELSKSMDFFGALILELWLQEHTYKKEQPYDKVYHF